MQYLEKALTLTKSCGNTNCQCGILIIIAELKWDMGDIGTTQIHAKEARKLAKLSGNLYKEAITLQTLAHCTRQHGDYRNSIFHLQRAKEILGICGMHGGIADGNIESSRAEIHQLKSEYTDARSIHTHILQHSDQNPLLNGWALVNIAQIDVMIGATVETVQKNLTEAKARFSTAKYFYGVTLCEMQLADLKLREGDTSSAGKILQDCLNLSWGKQTEVVSFCLERFADRERWHPAEHTPRWPIIYLGHAHQSNEKLAVHKALLFLGDVFNSQGDEDTAHSLFTAALEGFNAMDVHRSRAQCLLRLGDHANQKQNLSHAKELWEEARPLFERSSQSKEVAHIDARLAELEHNQKVLVHLSALHSRKQLS
jgi:tetratricopeptide (TPR) repeat protein